MAKASKPLRISGATVFIVLVVLFALLWLAPSAVARSMEPRARPKGQALVRVRAAIRSWKEGTTQPRCTLARGVPQASFASVSFPQIRISVSITNTRLWAIGTRPAHAGASDSPRRASVMPRCQTPQAASEQASRAPAIQLRAQSFAPPLSSW
jgi:hypothetical protein